MSAATTCGYSSSQNASDHGGNGQILAGKRTHRDSRGGKHRSWPGRWRIMKPLRSSRAWEASKADSAPGQLSARAAVSFPDEMLILVDQDGRSIGEASKQQCHEGRGLLHRAFSLLIFDQKGRLLLQQRAAEKLLWPGYWSNSCCSHPRTGEGPVSYTHLRAHET